MSTDGSDKSDRMPSVSGPSLGSTGASAPPDVEGYEIVRALGEGGMGIIYLARQKQPIQRQVALKVVKAGMDSKQVVARFEAERQALALLDHPNVAHVYDAGMTKDGHPYFSMEYVSGPPITEYCDRQKLSIEDRLRLFIQVCEGVQNAHQKGIIHRDLKPSNILVSTENGKPLPKIIDFGVAKALTTPLTEHTLFTEQGQLLGTPEYMSPEQAELTRHDIDTRADVYSLGILLYELLTGALPFGRDVLKRAGFTEILRIIREEDPLRPSARLSSLGTESSHTADSRKTSLNLLPRRVRGDLDWIVMKALEKDRNRRYGTAAELAADIGRHLNSEPVQAGPPTVSYRLSKFVHRHRVGVLATSLAVAALTAGSIVATCGLLKARQERDNAVVAESGARRSLYCAHMLMVRQNWEDGRVVGLQELLDAYRPQAREQDLRGWEWYYLNTLCNQSLLTLYGHIGAIRSVAWSPDGRYLASGSDDHTVRIWDWLNVKPVSVLSGHTAPVRSVAWSPNGRQLASAGNDATIRICDWANGKVGLTLMGHIGPVRAVTWSPDGQRIASGGRDGVVEVWDVTAGEQRHSLYCKDRSEAVRSVAWSPDGQWLAAGQRSGTEGNYGVVTLWDMTTLQHRYLSDLEGHGTVNSVAWNRDSRLVASTQQWSAIKIWDRVTEKKDFMLCDHVHNVHSAVWGADGQRIASAGDDQTIKIWDLATQEVLTNLCGHWGPVYSVVWSPDMRYVASGSQDWTVRVWDVTRTVETRGVHRFDNWVSSVSWSPDGERIATAYLTPVVKIWDPTTGQEVLTLRGHTDKVWCAAWSPDGRRLATASKDRTIKVWSTTGGPATVTLRGHEDIVFSVAWSPDGKKLASRGRDGNLIVWDADTAEVIFTLPTNRSFWAHSVKWSPDGQRLASTGEFGQVGIWDMSSGKSLHSLSAQAAEALSVAWSPEGNQLAVGYGNGTLRLWEVNEERQVSSFRVHADRVRSITWSPDGRRLASASTDGTVKIRDATTGEEVLTLHEHEAEVSSVAWSPDGKRLASGSFDCTVRIWDASCGYELQTGANLHSIWEAITTEKLDEASQQLTDLRASNNQLNHESRQTIETLATALAGAFHHRGKTAIQGNSRYARIIEDYQSALRIDPNYLPALNDLAWLLATCPKTEFRNSAEALRLATRACELTGWKQYLYVNSLAAAYAMAADYEAAAKWQKQAILLLPDDETPFLQRNYEYRLAQYEAGDDLRSVVGGIDPSLAIYYSFDEVGETVADQSGKGHDGIVVGDMSPEPGGKYNGAANFERGGYLDLGGPYFPVEDIPTSSVTIAAWVKCGNTGNHHTIFNARASDLTYVAHAEVRSSGELRWLLRSYGSRAPTAIFDLCAEGIRWDEWVHFAGTYDRISSKAALYVDGKLAKETDVARPADIAGDWNLGARVGRSVDGARPFTGFMDEFRLFTRALSEDKIGKIMQGT